MAYQQIKTTFLSNNFSHSQASHPHEWENRLRYWCMFIFSYSWWVPSVCEREKAYTWTPLFLTFPYIFVYYFLTVYLVVSTFTQFLFSQFFKLSQVSTSSSSLLICSPHLPRLQIFSSFVQTETFEHYHLSLLVYSNFNFQICKLSFFTHIHPFYFFPFNFFFLEMKIRYQIVCFLRLEFL